MVRRMEDTRRVEAVVDFEWGRTRQLAWRRSTWGGCDRSMRRRVAAPTEVVDNFAEEDSGECAGGIAMTAAVYFSGSSHVATESSPLVAPRPGNFDHLYARERRWWGRGGRDPARQLCGLSPCHCGTQTGGCDIRVAVEGAAASEERTERDKLLSFCVQR